MTASAQPNSQSLQINNLSIHYLEWGRPDAPPVVCVHGYTGSAQAFNALARHFQDRMRLIAPDVRGHGESAWAADGAYGYLDQAGDLAAVVDRLELEKFVLIGTSMGGVIAMAYAGSHPQRLKGLVINDVGPDVEQGSQRITSMVGARPGSFATLDEAMAYRRQISPITAARPEEDQRELALGVLQQGSDGRWVWKMDPAYIEQRIARGAPARPNLWPALEAVPCPTLVIWGSDSDVLSKAQAARMVDALPHGELVTVPGIGHAPTLVEPPVLRALERFL
jgi:pimeloyl-ACP methyl ester carboxylesterase